MVQSLTACAGSPKSPEAVRELVHTNARPQLDLPLVILPVVLTPRRASWPAGWRCGVLHPGRPGHRPDDRGAVHPVRMRR